MWQAVAGAVGVMGTACMSMNTVRVAANVNHPTRVRGIATARAARVAVAVVMVMKGMEDAAPAEIGRERRFVRLAAIWSG